jgi:hypothetical protein
MADDAHSGDWAGDYHDAGGSSGLEHESQLGSEYDIDHQEKRIENSQKELSELRDQMEALNEPHDGQNIGDKLEN